jgi:hypothetical protein
MSKAKKATYAPKTLKDVLRRQSELISDVMAGRKEPRAVNAECRRTAKMLKALEDKLSGRRSAPNPNP